MDDEPAGPKKIRFRISNAEPGRLVCQLHLKDVWDRARKPRREASGEALTVVRPRRHLGRTKPKGIGRLVIQE